MEALERLGAGHLRAVVVGYRDALRSHQESLNRLNVYPVPDGDTGTNMALTLEAVVAELGPADDTGMGDAEPPDMGSVCKAISHGSLMGARGNSGVILCQILRGISDAFEDHPEGGGAETVAQALREASDAAYGAVMRPVEGTILTVARAAADGAGPARGTSLVAVLDGARRAAVNALARTPEMLPVLKQAGVVDAGGAGLVLLLDAFLHVAAGRPLPAPVPPRLPAPHGDRPSLAAPPAAASRPEPGGGGTAGVADTGPRYEVMYLLDAEDAAIDGFKRAWASLGESIVVVGGDATWNCHIHTDDIGAAIEAAVEVGRPYRIRVADLFQQAHDRCVPATGAGAAAPADERRAEGPPTFSPHAPHAPQEPHEPLRPVVTAVVAVAAGDGLARICAGLGAQQVVAGGQSMNPSTAQILEAVEAAPAQEVVVLPNNANVVAVAEQVGSLTAKTVRVVRTTSAPEGLAALLAYDPGAGADDNAVAMEAAASAVTVGEVTTAVRSASSPAGPVAAGDHLGLSRDGIEVVSSVLEEAATGLLARLVGDEHEIVTVIEGDGSTAEATRRITDWLAEHRPGAAVEVHHGGQPLYPYLFSIE
jgi:DAK2 domain fusion protein YloV